MGLSRLLVVLIVVALSGAAGAQQPKKIPRVGILFGATCKPTVRVTPNFYFFALTTASHTRWTFDSHVI